VEKDTMRTQVKAETDVLDTPQDSTSSTKLRSTRRVSPPPTSVAAIDLRLLIGTYIETHPERDMKKRLFLREQMSVLLKDKLTLLELGNNRRSILYDIISLSYDHRNATPQNLAERSDICKKLMSTLFVTGDAGTIATLMMTPDDKQDLPSLDLFKLDDECWKAYFKFITKKIPNEETRKQVALTQFLNKNQYQQNLFTIALFEDDIKIVARYFSALKYSLDKKLIDVESLDAILDVGIVTAATSAEKLRFCLQEFMSLKQDYGWNPNAALTAKNSGGFDFLQAFIGNCKREERPQWQELEYALQDLDEQASNDCELQPVIKSLILNRTSLDYTIMHQAANAPSALPVVFAFLYSNRDLCSASEWRLLLTQKTQNGFTCLHQLALTARRTNDIVQLKNFIYQTFPVKEANTVWKELLTTENDNGYLPSNARNKIVGNFLNAERAAFEATASSSSTVQASIPSISRTLSNEGLFAVGSGTLFGTDTDLKLDHNPSNFNRP
jgi:hypothetical protein